MAWGKKDRNILGGKKREDQNFMGGKKGTENGPDEADMKRRSLVSQQEFMKNREGINTLQAMYPNTDPAAISPEFAEAKSVLNLSDATVTKKKVLSKRSILGGMFG
jgi:hypothetical protein